VKPIRIGRFADGQESRDRGSNRVRSSQIVRLAPILFFFTYLTGTVILFAVGPWPYPVANGVKLYLFLATAHLALLAGYVSGVIRNPRRYVGRWTVNHLVKAGLIATAVLLVPTIVTRTGSVTPDLSAALTNPGEAYALSFEARGAAGPLVEYCRIMAGPLLTLIPALPIFFWSRISYWYRGGTVVLTAGTAILFIAMGTNKALADLVIVVPWMILAARAAGLFRFRMLLAASLLSATVFGFLAFFLFFGSTQVTRSGANPWYLSRIGIHADENSAPVKYLPETERRTAIGLASYLTQGYYGLSLALEQPFRFSYGVGHSMFLFRQVARIPGLAWIGERPYPIRMEAAGWDAYGLFSSIYPWLASDVGFGGTVVLLFLLGRLLALTWIDTIFSQNPFAVALFGQLLIMFSYFSANNQCLQTGEGVSSFWIVLFAWLASRAPEWRAVRVAARWPGRPSPSGARHGTLSGDAITRRGTSANAGHPPRPPAGRFGPYGE
jgi:hypothetical protein